MTALMEGSSGERMTEAELCKATIHLSYALPTEVGKHGFTLEQLTEKLRNGAIAIMQMMEGIEAEKTRREKALPHTRRKMLSPA